MKNLTGIILVITGICCGLYFGVWWAFIGGICDVIGAIRAENLIAIDVAIGVAKVFFAGLIGWASGFLVALPGIAMLDD